MFLSSLTDLSLPPLRSAVLGLLVAVTGLSAPAQGPQAPLLADAIPVMESTAHPLSAYFAGPGVADITSEAAAALRPPPPSFQKHPNGATVVTIQWDTNDGESIERHSTDLVLAAPAVPEPSPVFLGACAGCIVLLHRRRVQPSNYRHARVNLSASGAAEVRARRLAPSIESRSARAPQERMAPRRRRLVATRAACTAHPFPGRLHPSRP